MCEQQRACPLLLLLLSLDLLIMLHLELGRSVSYHTGVGVRLYSGRLHHHRDYVLLARWHLRCELSWVAAWLHRVAIRMW